MTGLHGPEQYDRKIELAGDFPLSLSETECVLTHTVAAAPKSDPTIQQGRRLWRCVPEINQMEPDQAPCGLLLDATAAASPDGVGGGGHGTYGGGGWQQSAPRPGGQVRDRVALRAIARERPRRPPTRIARLFCRCRRRPFLTPA